MARKRSKAGRRLADILEMPRDVVFDLPVIQTLGSEELSVANYKGLVEYSGVCVRVNTTSGQVRFEGTGLVLKHVTSETVSITGRIDKIEFVK